MNRDTNLIWESYVLLNELAVSKANIQRVMTKFGVTNDVALDLITRYNEVEGSLYDYIFNYKTLDELYSAIAKVTKEREKVTKGANKVFENDKAEVFYIKTKEASIKLGRGTKWCISYDDSDPSDEDDGPGNLFNTYTSAWIFDDDYNSVDNEDHDINIAAIYFVLDKSNTVNKFAAVVGKFGYKEIRDRNNSMVPGIGSILSAYNIPEEVFKYAPLYTQEAIENKVLELDNPYLAYAVASDLYQPDSKRWLRGEPLIMKDPVNAANYARYIIKDEWPEGESSILKSGAAAYFYANMVLKRRWPEGEPIIMQTPELAFKCARDVIKDRWPEAESILMRDPVHYNAYKRWFAQKDMADLGVYRLTAM